MATMMDAPLSVTTTSSGGSRLAQMQARFQQKQMQEKEQKLLQLYESQTQRAFQRVGRGSAGSSSSSVSSTSSSLGAGKVRQLFQERRQHGSKAGWDRSHPLEPLENTTKQRLQASKSTDNLKIARGTSLERSHSHGLAANQARRSKSQVRSNVVADLGGSYRQQKAYYDDEDDEVDYRQDEQNNRIYVQHETREALFFNQQRMYDNEVDEDDDIENEDPPFQQLDDDDDDVVNEFHGSSQAFQKLANVGARVDMENNNNVDKYKTYIATTNGIRNVRRSVKDEKKKEPLRRRQQDVVTATKPSPPRSSPAVKKPETKLSSYTGSRGQTQRIATPSKQNSVEPVSWDRKSAARKVPTEDTERQMIQRDPPARGPPPRGQPLRGSPTTQSATSRSRGSAPRATPSRPGPPSKVSNADLAECKMCGRNFAKDRIDVHQKICNKTSQKKRKVFDPTKQRVKGTDAEQFLRKGKPQPVTHTKKTNWRQKHEDFINSIRAAKEMKVHLAKGGKLSDLPPPPPSDYSDYVQCPHCSRRFNQDAAERHIPKCATYEFNKPKSQGAGRGRGAVPKKR